MARDGKARVVVAMSGGVDSSVACDLIRLRGFDPVGITFKTWPKEECGESYSKACCSLAAITRARATAEKVGAPFYVLDLYETFKREVIDYFVDEYARGRTPNPCIVCNEKIKFGALIDKAAELGARYVATGHFARVRYDARRRRYLLRCGKDSAKDQSYFLFSLSQDQLAKILFPVGDWTKAHVRAYAGRRRLPSYDTESSQDVCFVHDKSYREYLEKRGLASVSEGPVVDADGKVLGRHKGIPFYTIGQRKGLGIAYRHPLYVTGFDIRQNRIIVGEKAQILRRGLVAERVNLIKYAALNEPRKVQAKIRYNHPKADAWIFPSKEGTVRVEFDHKQEAPTPGQAAVFYEGDDVVGGGWIREAL
jgi:tRNA-uridine 2-sulfurtransferase